MRRSQRLALAALTAAGLLLSPTAALAAPVPEGAGDGKASSDVVTLDLYNLTDIHGHIEKVESRGKVTEAGLSAMSCYVKKAKKDNPNSQLVLLGDNIGASPFTSGSQHDNPTIAALNKMDVFASTIGNHEFDKGQDVLRARLTGSAVAGVSYEKVGFPYLGANVTGLDGLGDYKVWESPAGVKVAFIGAIEDDAETKVFPGTFAGMTFTKPVPVINELATKLKTTGAADVVIAMYDNDVERSYPLMGEHVDGIMGGDTHKPYYFTKVKTAEGRDISATASGSFTDNLANLQISYDTKARKVVDSKAIQIPAATVAECGEDPDVKAVVDNAVKVATEKGAEVISDGTGNFSRGYQETKKDGKVSRGENRGTESTIGGLIADAMREKITTLDKQPIDIGIINAGGIRADLLPEGGKVSVADVFRVQPFSNEVGYVKMTGAQFVTLLEQQWKELGANSSRPMLKLGLSKNVSYTFDPARPMGERITSVLVDGKPIDRAKTYTVGSVTFLLSGGDSFDILKDPAIAATLKTIPDSLDRDFLGSYLKDNPTVQPRAAVQSVGVTIESTVTDQTATAKVWLRGLSFSGDGEGKTMQAVAKLGDVTGTEPVSNDLEDPKAATADAVVTADGVGYTLAPITLTATAVCTGEESVRLPLTVSNEKGVELVSAASGLGVDVPCTTPGEQPPADDEQPNQCTVMDRPAMPARASNQLGEATGDRFADLWSVDEDGAIHFYSGNGKGGFYHEGIVMCGQMDVMELAPAEDVNGDGRADLLARYSNGDLYYFYSAGDGFLTKGIKAGHGWSGMDNIAFAGKIGDSGTDYVIARQIATGDLYRYTVSTAGLYGGTKIGHGWSGMNFVLAPGQFVGSPHADLIGIRSDGAMFAYAGTPDGRVYGVGQVGHGWKPFFPVIIPGDLDGDGSRDLLGVRMDGKLFSYQNLTDGWWGPATQAGHGWDRMHVLG